MSLLDPEIWRLRAGWEQMLKQERGLVLHDVTAYPKAADDVLKPVRLEVHQHFSGTTSAVEKAFQKIKRIL
jgi:hypothetical protein